MDFFERHILRLPVDEVVSAQIANPRELADWPWQNKSEDMVFVIIFAVLFTWARVTVQQFFQQYAQRNNIKEAKKFSESCWKSMFYISSWTWGAFLVYQANIFPEVRNCWIDFGSSMSFHMKMFYLAELGFYAHSLYAHVAIEVKRTDYWALFFHHLVSIALIYLSYSAACHNIGVLVLVCHDTSDVLFEFGKALLYGGEKWITNVLFALFVLSWMVTRLTFFPFWLIHSAIYDAYELIPWVLRPSPYYPLYPIFISWLCFLQVLHVYWYVLILRTAYRKITRKELADPREEKEE